MVQNVIQIAIGINWFRSVKISSDGFRSAQVISQIGTDRLYIVHGSECFSDRDRYKLVQIGANISSGR